MVNEKKGYRTNLEFLRSTCGKLLPGLRPSFGTFDFVTYKPTPLTLPFASHFLKLVRWQQVKLAKAHGGTCSIGHPPHSSASPVELRLRVGPRALSGQKKEVRVKGVLRFVCLSVMA